MRRPEPAPDRLIGREVIIRSVAGIEYSGVVRTISPGDGGDELFELGRADNPTYQRYVYVSSRDRQIRPGGAPDREAERPP